jgi:hypothetical protein
LHLRCKQVLLRVMLQVRLRVLIHLRVAAAAAGPSAPAKPAAGQEHAPGCNATQRRAARSASTGGQPWRAWVAEVGLALASSMNAWTSGVVLCSPMSRLLEYRSQKWNTFFSYMSCNPGVQQVGRGKQSGSSGH